MEDAAQRDPGLGSDRHRGGHVVLLIGYNRTAGYFLVKNSWGGTAPSAYLKFSDNFVRNAAYGAATVNSVVSPSSSPQAKARWIGKWYQDHEGWRGTMVVRRITPVSNSAVPISHRAIADFNHRHQSLLYLKA